ncbi:MAG: hypothetical protein KDE59_00745 [Anaerolineales bacterium]|nr:hypothetical protein [Anaerolineales bacterium]MCB0015073.1 hypothetical protein [Anaerolineales bacterium]MCB0030065.1 hypothetical protein [Anaerolineales bacterium]MCB8959119.1 hypothetical protein [Ardenticatenales bacterium]
MADFMVILGVALIAVGLLWGFFMAFQHSAVIGLLTLISGFTFSLVFLVTVRPKGYQRPVFLMAFGLVLALVGNAFT